MDFGTHSGPETNPADAKGGLKPGRDSKVTCSFFIAGVSNPNPYVVQVSTPFWNHLHLSTLQYLQVFVVLFLFFCVCILSRVYSCYL